MARATGHGTTPHGTHGTNGTKGTAAREHGSPARHGTACEERTLGCSSRRQGKRRHVRSCLGVVRAGEHRLAAAVGLKLAQAGKRMKENGA